RRREPRHPGERSLFRSVAEEPRADPGAELKLPVVGITVGDAGEPRDRAVELARVDSQHEAGAGGVADEAIRGTRIEPLPSRSPLLRRDLGFEGVVKEIGVALVGSPAVGRSVSTP